MNKTVDLLYDNINNGYFSLLDNSVINDYFGNQINKENYDIIYGVYESLIILKGISKNLIEHCYLTNRLDELIYKKHINIKTDYYNLFMKNNIIIGSTFFYDNKTKLLNIYDDNHCPSCNANNYLKSSSFECYKCLNTICSLCSFYDEKNNIYTCNKCENPNLETVINKKITECKKEDKIKFNKEGNINFDDIKELLRKQKFKCYICSSMMITYQWKPKCLHQFEFDLINKQLPYNKDNVRICCNFCINPTENNKKICKNKCHYDNTIISRKKNII